MEILFQFFTSWKAKWYYEGETQKKENNCEFSLRTLGRTRVSKQQGAEKDLKLQENRKKDTFIGAKKNLHRTLIV